MAGKHAALNLKPEDPPIYPGYRDDRAYSEGRQLAFEGGLITADPHPTGTPESDAWLNGFGNADFAGAQIQTAYAGTI